MAKKYLSIEEAAELLGLETSELNRLREKGEIRAFADRGTWKFKQEDVENLTRTRQADSDPDVPLHVEKLLRDAGPRDEEETHVESHDDDAGQGVLDDDALSEQPTIIRRSKADEGASDSDVRLIFDDSMSVGSGSSGELGIPLSDSDSDVRLEKEAKADAGSDSDVTLDHTAGIAAGDSDSDVTLDPGSMSDVKLVGAGTDSDVKLVGSGSDSDVKLVGAGSDSDVKLVDGGSDSDVRLAGLPGESGVSLVPKGKSGSEKKPASGKSGSGKKTGSGKGKDFKLPHDVSSEKTEEFALSPLADDSVGSETIDLSPTGGSGKGSVLDDDDDSGISLAGDSGISLAGDSGISLASASGISLDQPNDSGISLDDDSALALTGDSGFSLGDAGDSGIALGKDPSSGVKKPSSSKKHSGSKKPASAKPPAGAKKPVSSKPEAGGKKGSAAKPSAPSSADDLNSTIPMLEAPLGDDDLLDSHLDTQMDIPLLDDTDDSDFDISSGSEDASVITLGDDEDVDHASATMVKKKGAGAGDDEDLLDEGMFDAGAGDAEELSEAEDADDLDVSDEIVGEDDEIEDVFGAEDEDFDAGVETGESHAEMPVSVGARGMAAPVEQDWGVASFIGLSLSTVVMLLCGTVMFDLIRSMWYADAEKVNPVSVGIIDIFKSM